MHLNKVKAYLLLKIFKSIYKPGSFYSTVPDIKLFNSTSHPHFNKRTVNEVVGVSFQLESMRQLLLDGKILLNEKLPFIKETSSRYYSNNIFFNEYDAKGLQFIIRQFKPARIIEVGSGFSSALMLDIRDRYFSPDTLSLTFVEPYPERLYSLLSESDKSNVIIHESEVQLLNYEVFLQLQENDLLFIDSSHVSKIGSDLNFLLFEILPRLNKGVIIHFHDIFFPFEYPQDWILNGISWNEAYLLRSFLMFNDSFEIILFNNLVGKELVGEGIPDLSGGASIYLRKIK